MAKAYITSTEEFVPRAGAIWQSDTAKTYQCDVCKAPVFTQYEGDALPTIECHGLEGHLVKWPSPPVAREATKHG